MNDEVGVPPAARLVRDFVNTYEPQVDVESLTSAADLGDWLADRRLVSSGAQLTADDLATAIIVREGLRTLLLEHAGHVAEVDAEPAVLALNQILGELPVRLTFTDGGYRLSSASAHPFGEAVGALAEAIRECTEDGTWPRLKVCARDTCRWAFYDGSRNQVRRWCSMAGCGNHIKMKRAYAVRKNRGQTAAGSVVS